MTAVNHFIKKGVRQARIDEFLAKELQRAGYGGVEITKTPLGERITIYASRPGIVIGRRGKNIRMITDILANEYGIDNPQIEVKEVVNPELNPKVMAYTLVSAIERGVHRRRAAYSVLRRVLNAGAKGCEIIISGKLTSKRSRHEAYRMGFLAKSGEVGNQYVKTANATAIMKLGTIGVTVSIMRGDIDLPDEITIKSIKFEEPTVEAVEKEAKAVKEEKALATKAEKAKPAEKAAAPVEKIAKEKAAVKEEKTPVAKKTSLDLEVEELSELIEKEPGEEDKPKKKEKAKAPEKKAEKSVEKKPTAKTAPKEKAEEKKEPAKAKKKNAEKKALAKTAEKPKKSAKAKEAAAPKTETKTTKKDGKTSSKTKKEMKAKATDEEKKRKKKKKKEK